MYQAFIFLSFQPSFGNSAFSVKSLRSLCFQDRDAPSSYVPFIGIYSHSHRERPQPTFALTKFTIHGAVQRGRATARWGPDHRPATPDVTPRLAPLYATAADHTRVPSSRSKEQSRRSFYFFRTRDSKRERAPPSDHARSRRPIPCCERGCNPQAHQPAGPPAPGPQ